MNELIEKLRRQLNKGEITFGDAIQTACKAQRNACVREWTNTHFDYEIGCNILNAEIKREDYE